MGRRGGEGEVGMGRREEGEGKRGERKGNDR